MELGAELASPWRRSTSPTAEVAKALAATWRATRPAESAPSPDRSRSPRTTEKLTFTMNPCGSGPAVWRRAATGRDGWGSPTRPTTGATAAGLPALLHPLRVHERGAADRLDRLPGVPVRPARGLRPRSLRLALVQGPRRHSRAALDRYGLERSDGGRGAGRERRPRNARGRHGRATGGGSGSRGFQAARRARPT